MGFIISWIYFSAFYRLTKYYYAVFFSILLWYTLVVNHQVIVGLPPLKSDSPEILD